MIARLRASNAWKFFAILPRADRPLALAWWAVLVLRGILPALFAIAMGLLVGAVERGGERMVPLVLVGAIFMTLQVLSPIHRAIGANLGNKTAALFYDRLTLACVGPPVSATSAVGRRIRLSARESLNHTNGGGHRDHTT